MDTDLGGEKREKKVVHGDMETQRRVGGWKTMPFLLGNETFEKLASMGVVMSLQVYLIKQYHVGSVLAVTITAVWNGSCNLAPLFGAYIADTFLGRFLALILGILASTLGMGILTITAAIPALRPPECIKNISCIEPEVWQLGVLYIGLGFIVIGAGAIRPCNIAFAVDQFDLTTKKGRGQVERFYNWYYLTFTIALIVSLTGVVYVQNSVSWTYGLAIPTICMVLSGIVFVLGKKFYVFVKPNGSVLTDIAKVIVASFKKRNLKGEEYSFYDPIQSDLQVTTKRAHTSRFKCLDKAAMITDQDEFDSQRMPVNGWRLCSVEQVDKLKSVIGILPVWAAGIHCFIVMDQQNTFGVQQGMLMDTKLTKKIEVPPPSLGIASMVALSIYIVIYDFLIFPLSKRVSKVGITLKHRMMVGILLSMLCMTIAGLIERKRRDMALKHVSPISLAWLLPQFALSGLVEATMAIALMEFFNSQLPQSMRAFANAFFFLNLSFSSYLNSVMVNIVQRSKQLKWFSGHDLNQNRLEYYYFLNVAIGALNLIYFTTLGSRYIVSVDSGEDSNMDEETNSYRESTDTQLHHHE